MSMRISRGLLLLPMLAGCSGGETPEGPPVGTEQIACATAGSADFKPVCGVQRVKTGLVIWHPNGAFRRLSALTEGAGFATTDGADQLAQKLSGDTLEVTIGEDRYRLPVKVDAPAQ